jgi:hypothetical protein
MKVSTDELRRATLALLRHLDESGQKIFDINEDFYWDVPADKRYSPYSEPTGLTLGQLSDEWADVAKMADGSREPVAYGLVWLAAVLRRVGETATG